jgi:hypothetical protein
MKKVSGVAALSPALRSACESVRALLAGGARDDARARYRVGVIVSAVMNAPGKYGSRAVDEIARAVGTNVHTLYRAAAVAECWSEPQMDALLQRTNGFEQPLSWSHLVLLAGVISTKRRAELVDKALRDDLTVRQLAVLVDDGGQDPSTDEAFAVLHRVVRAAEQWSQKAEAMHEELLAELGGADSGAGEPALLIERAIAAEERLKELVDRQLEWLRAERGRFGPHEAPSVRTSGLLLAGVRPR